MIYIKMKYGSSRKGNIINSISLLPNQQDEFTGVKFVDLVKVFTKQIPFKFCSNEELMDIYRTENKFLERIAPQYIQSNVRGALADIVKFRTQYMTVSSDGCIKWYDISLVIE